MASIWKSYKIEKPHQYKSLESGQGDWIFEYTIPNNHVGFIEYVGSNYFDGTWFQWFVDGEDVEGKIYRELGNVSVPIRLDPPILFKKSIKVYAYNGDIATQILEWLCDGIVYHRG
jgi:hypothetical protein